MDTLTNEEKIARALRMTEESRPRMNALSREEREGLEARARARINGHKYAKFLGKNGYAIQLEEAKKLLKVGEFYEVIGGHIADSTSSYKLKDFPNISFNAVMFEADYGVESILDKGYRGYPEI